MLRRLTLALLFVALALVCAGFVRLNRAPTLIDLYVGVLPSSVGEALIGAVLVGWLAGLAGALAWGWRLVRERRALARSLRLAEGELRALRAAAPAHAR